MTTKSRRRWWVTVGMIDAMLLLGAGSAMAAQNSAPFEPSVHLPSVLLAGIGLVWVALAQRRAN